MHRESYVSYAKNFLNQNTCESCIWRHYINDNFSVCRRNFPKNWLDLEFDNLSRVNLNDTCPFWFDMTLGVKAMKTKINKSSLNILCQTTINLLTIKEIRKIVRQENGNG